MKVVTVLTVVLVAVHGKPFVDEPDHRAPDLSKVKFFLYTRNNRDNPDDIPFDFSIPPSPNYDPAKKTFVIIHGWNSDIDLTSRFSGDLLDNTDCNVFGIDWSDLESWTNYFAAAETSMDVGVHVGEFISKLVLDTSLMVNDVHVIGHSLGAQGSGHAGRTVFSRTGSKVARITGLDPAKPYFDVIDESKRISKNDAAFVDILHSNSGSLFDGCLSFPDPLGHVDYYPSGGDHQPGCTEFCMPGCTENDLIDLLKGGCSHGRANEFFIESINSIVPFTATKCDSWDNYVAGNCAGAETVEMGFNCNSGYGSFFLSVNKESPYAQG